MQSFKEYLLESAGHLPIVNVQIDFAGPISVGKRKTLVFLITKFIKEEYNLSNTIEFTSIFDSIIVKIHDVPQHLFETVDFLGDIHDIVTDHFEPVDAYSHIECHWPPAFKMVIQNHLTTIYTNQESVKGIEKLIEGSSAFQLDIRFEAPAKSIGILSLLKVKGFEINVADGSNFKSLWGIPDACDQLNISVPSLETLEHCTPVIKDSLYLYTPNLKSFDCGKVSIAQELKIGSIGKAPLRDLHKHFAVPQIRFYNTALHLIKQKPLLSLLKCNAKLTWGSIMTINGTSLTEVVEVLKILNKYNSSSIIQCQRELIEKDLDEYAEF
jgi:hypothetical protein